MYQVQSCLKSWEQDEYTKGCIPNTGGLTSIDARHIRASTVAGLVAKINAFCGNDDPDAVLIDACEEPGRIDVQLMETDDGVPASPSDLVLWKQGKRRLWLADYSFLVVQTQTVPLAYAA